MEQHGKSVYIFGHMNPDTDSTCSAIAYAYLKNRLNPESQYISAILSDINPETQYVLDHFNVPVPPLLKSLAPLVSDIPLKPVPHAHELDSIRKVLEMIANHSGRSIPIVDKGERLIGIVSISDLVPMLLASHQKTWLTHVNIPFNNLIENLQLTLIQGFNSQEIFLDNIYFFNDLNEGQSLTSMDLIICNESEYESGQVRTFGAGFIIITDYHKPDSSPEIIGGSPVVSVTTKNTYEVLQSISQSFPIQSVVRKIGIEYFSTYETVEDVKKNMLTSKFRRFPVVDERGSIQGMISRSDLAFVQPKGVILVDHNEKAQSIEGIKDVRILEVIDHHRVANIQTEGPLYFRVEPLGSTCTIVAKLFDENDITIPKDLAGLLVSGILSDTLLFKSPTCTPIDEMYAKKLAAIAELQILNYGMKMITKGAELQNESPEAIISTDLKRFTFGDNKVAIAQINIANFESFYKIFEGVKAAIRQKCKEEKFDLFLLMVTSIIIGGSEIIAIGEAKWIADHAFNINKNEDSIFLNDVYSRKKQIVPKLMLAANQ